MSELWAYALLQEDGDTLRQPCTVPLMDTIPFELRERVCKAYARCIADLQAAIKMRENAAAGDDVAAARLAAHHETGAWVIVLRIFPAAILRDYGGGGVHGRTPRELRRALKLWDKGDYVTAYLRRTPRAVRR